MQWDLLPNLVPSGVPRGNPDNIVSISVLITPMIGVVGQITQVISIKWQMSKETGSLKQKQ